MFSFVVLSLCVSLAFGGVKVLNNENFDNIALDPDKNVFVEFYSQECPQCQTMSPTYEKVAEIFKNNKDCIVAKVDAEGEQGLASKFDVLDIPTFKFFPKGEKNAIDYTGEFFGEDLVNFLNKECHADHSFKE